MASYYQAKTAVITGAGSGIGKAIAKKLSEYGASYVACLDIDLASAEQTAVEIASAGGKAGAFYCDVADKGSLKEAIGQAVASAGGRLGLMFNNAGIRFSTDASVSLEERYDEMMHVNLRGEVFGSLYALEYMKKQGYGHIVNVASIAGIVPGASGIGYSTAKAGVVSYTLNVRIYYRKLGIRATVLCPSGIATPMEGFREDGSRDSSYPKTKVTYLPAEKFAEIALKNVAKNKAIVPVGYQANNLWSLFRLSPQIYDELVGRYTSVEDSTV